MIDFKSQFSEVSMFRIYYCSHLSFRILTLSLFNVLFLVAYASNLDFRIVWAFWVWSCCFRVFDFRCIYFWISNSPCMCFMIRFPWIIMFEFRGSGASDTQCFEYWCFKRYLLHFIVFVVRIWMFIFFFHVWVWEFSMLKYQMSDFSSFWKFETGNAW